MAKCDAGSSGFPKLFADRAPMKSQLSSDLAQSPALDVQVGRTLNVHGATVTIPSLIT
jgi:hypothetical protein